MKRGAVPAGVAGWILLWTLASWVQAQDSPIKHASDYTSVEYYDPPNGLQISSRTSGAEVLPMPGGHLLMFKQFRLETFATNGTPEFIVEAPNCRYDQSKGLASSPGHLTVRSADGQVTLEGDGFLWLQDDKFLIISNNVDTIIKPGPKIIITP